jgi:hypothetical protein
MRHIPGHTWARVVVQTTGILGGRGSSPFVVSYASDGLTLRVTYPHSLQVEVAPLCPLNGDAFPFEGRQVGSTGARRVTEWQIEHGLLPWQGLELIWYPRDDERKFLVRRVFLQVWMQARYRDLGDLVAPDYWIEESGSQERHVGPAGLEQLVREYRRGFSNLNFKIVKQLVRGDAVTTYWQAYGTHDGTFRGIPKTGQSVDGRIVGRSVSRVDLATKWVLCEEVTWNYTALLAYLKGQLGQPMSTS